MTNIISFDDEKSEEEEKGHHIFCYKDQTISKVQICLLDGYVETATAY